MPSHITLRRIPEDMRLELIKARRERGWSQAELGKQVGLPQMHISGIETGKVVPRFDTLLELVRVLGHDLVMVRRSLVPVVQSLVRDQENPDGEERSLYAADYDEA